jgi:hypothetical protein
MLYPLSYGGENQPSGSPGEVQTLRNPVGLRLAKIPG